MKKEEITARQAGKIYDALMPTLGFLAELEVRLAELGFPATDGYYAKVKAARAAFTQLTVETHTLSRSNGAGRAEGR